MNKYMEEFEAGDYGQLVAAEDYREEYLGLLCRDNC